MSVELGSHATSYTSRSCAISCVTAVDVSRFQTVHVVSIEEDHEARHLLVPRNIGERRSAALTLHLGLLWGETPGTLWIRRAVENMREKHTPDKAVFSESMSARTRLSPHKRRRRDGRVARVLKDAQQVAGRCK